MVFRSSSGPANPWKIQSMFRHICMGGKAAVGLPHSWTSHHSVCCPRLQELPAGEHEPSVCHSLAAWPHLSASATNQQSVGDKHAQYHTGDCLLHACNLTCMKVYCYQIGRLRVTARVRVWVLPAMHFGPDDRTTQAVADVWSACQGAASR